MPPDDHSAWGPRAHPERCDEWTEDERVAHRINASVHLVIWGGLIGALGLWLSWPLVRSAWNLVLSWLPRAE